MKERSISFLIVVGLLVLAQWLWGDPSGLLGPFRWAAYGVGAILALGALMGMAAGIWVLVGRVRRGIKGPTGGPQLHAPAYFFSIDDGGEEGTRELGVVKIVPALALVEVSFRKLSEAGAEARQRALSTLVNDAVERLEAEAPPATWTRALPEALGSLQQQGFVLCDPRGGLHWYDPDQYPTATPSLRESAAP